MFIGEIIEIFEVKLNVSDYFLEEKCYFGVLYIVLKLCLYYIFLKFIYDLFFCLVDNFFLGMKIKFGLVWVDGINVKYDSVYIYFGELINVDFNDKEIKVYVFVYFILIYNEV